MKKTLLLNFINKHTPYLEKVRWVSDDKNKTLRVCMATDARDLLCDVTLSNWEGFEKAELGILDLAKLDRELKGIVGDEITFSLNYNDAKTQVISFDATDGPSTATVVLSDLDILPQSTVLKKKVSYEAEIIFNAEFKQRFLKAKAALPDVDDFAVLMNKKNVLEMVIGYSSINSSRYTLQVKTNPGKDVLAAPLRFGAGYLKSILDVNSECDDSVLKISDSGICNIEFKFEDLESKYYIVAAAD